MLRVVMMKMMKMRKMKKMMKMMIIIIGKLLLAARKLELPISKSFHPSTGMASNPLLPQLIG